MTRSSVPRPQPWASLHVWAAYGRARELERRRSWNVTVRTPPRPPYEHAPKGRCRMCGQECEGRRRTWCSDECVAIWFLATDSGYAARHLIALHGRACWTCGATSEPEDRTRWSPFGPLPSWPVVLEVEHVRPLWSLTDAERCDLRWWLPSNLQMLCRPCHRAKSAREAAERATLRRRTGTLEPA